MTSTIFLVVPAGTANLVELADGTRFPRSSSYGTLQYVTDDYFQAYLAGLVDSDGNPLLVELVPPPVPHSLSLSGPSGSGGSGINAVTTTTAAFTQPLAGSTVTVSVGSTAWMAAGQEVYIATGGYYAVSSIPNLNTVVLTNSGYAGNAAAGATIVSNSTVSPGGLQGPAGSGGGGVSIDPNGDLQISSFAVNTRLPFDFPGTADYVESDYAMLTAGGFLANVKVACKTAPVGAALIISVRRNGAEIASVSVAAGSTTATLTGLSVWVLDTDLISVAITQIGSTTPGGGISVVAEVDHSQTGTYNTQTFTIASSTDDQRIQAQDTTYPPTTLARSTNGAITGPSRSFETIPVPQVYTIRTFLLRWDTSSIPDTSTVVSARLSMAVADWSTVFYRNITADYYTWNGSSTSDYVQAAQTGAIMAEPLRNNPQVVGAIWKIPLTNVATGISKTGTTYVRMHIDGGQPSEYNYASFFTFDDTGGHQKPQLIVEYQ